MLIIISNKALIIFIKVNSKHYATFYSSFRNWNSFLSCTKMESWTIILGWRFSVPFLGVSSVTVKWLPCNAVLQVFSMLDTQSVCYTAAACSFFRKCALDPLCYASIDLMTLVPKVNNVVVSTMIQRAGKALR